MASFKACTSAAVIGGGGAGAGVVSLAGAPDAGFSAQTPVVKTASVRAMRNRVLVAFMEFQSSPFLVFG
jgi:hypothetical protein